MTEYLVWIDCEMTGLNLDLDELCEIAVVVTDEQLNPVDEGMQIVIRPSEVALTSMGEFVTQMHTESGLITELDSGVPVAEAERQVLEYVKNWIPLERAAPLAGNSIGTDRMFLLKQMPELEKHLHYRNVDVSSLKELARRWYPRTYFNLPKKNGGHRALADILESIQELRYYRETILVPVPGPDSTAARAAAVRI